MEDFAQESTGGGDTPRAPALPPVARATGRGLRLTVALLAATLLPVAAAQQEVSPEVQSLYEKARASQAANDEPAAIIAYQKILKLAPGLAPAYNNLGRLLYNQGRFSEAAGVLRRGLAINPDMPPAKVVLGASLLQLGQPDAALAPLQAGVEALPTDRFARISLARAQMALDHPDLALPQLETILQTDPKDQEAWYLVGKLHLQLSQEAFSRVQSIDGNAPLAHVLEGEVMESMQNTPGAITAYKQALTAAPNNAGALQHLADIYWTTGDWAHAREQYVVLLTHEPGNCTAHWRLAKAIDELGEPIDAGLKELNSALDQCPQLPEARAERARLLIRSGHAKQALADLDAAVAIAPQEPELQRLFAQAYRALGDKAHADQANQRFVELDRAQHLREEKRAAAVVEANH